MGWSRVAVSVLIGVACVALALGLLLPVVSIRRGLSRETYSVLAGIVDLLEGGNVLLALIVFAFSVVFPITKLAALLAIVFLPSRPARRARALRSLTLLGRWSMLDVFVVAILVGSVQLGWLSEARPQPGLYVFAAAILLSMLATMLLDRLVVRPVDRFEIRALRTREKSGRWVSALACALFLLGLSLPLMRVEKWLWWDNHYSVLGGIRRLADEGQGALAGVLVVLVVVLPLARFAGLAWLQWGRASPGVARAVRLVDKWAMLDVFCLALLIVSVKIGDMASVDARPGFWILLAAVSLSLYDSWKLQRTGERPRAAPRVD